MSVPSQPHRSAPSLGAWCYRRPRKSGGRLNTSRLRHESCRDSAVLHWDNLACHPAGFVFEEIKLGTVRFNLVRCCTIAPDCFKLFQVSYFLSFWLTNIDTSVFRPWLNWHEHTNTMLSKLASTFCSQLLKLKTGTLVCLQPETNCENSFPSAIWVFL